PAGATAATALARRGHAVVLIDREAFPREKLCGDFVSPALWPLFRILNVDREILAAAHEKVRSARFTSHAGSEVSVPISRLEAKAPFGLGIRRSTLDHLLLRAAVRSGARVLEKSSLKDLEREPRGWRLQVERGKSADTLRAEVLIGADGRNSRVARRLGLDRAAALTDPAVGLQFRLANFSGSPGTVEIHVFPGGYAGVIQLGDGTANLCLSVARERLRGQPLADTLPRLELTRNPFLERLLRGAEVVRGVRSVYPVYFPPRRSYGERVLLAGDASRAWEPVTGEGVYFAAASGWLAAKTVHDAFSKGDFSAARFSDYERECARAFGRRQKLNRLIRYLVWRPRLLHFLIRYSSMSSRALGSLVDSVCSPDGARFSVPAAPT
ncbi:MAG TPA: FAD-dependent monooxygenase, partial [candidate division Zixibacteria bacterium]|nr:FAD-dependent monooxygenase [candidate division Zixibacteria bacterium]